MVTKLKPEVIVPRKTTNIESPQATDRLTFLPVEPVCWDRTTSVRQPPYRRDDERHRGGDDVMGGDDDAQR